VLIDNLHLPLYQTFAMENLNMQLQPGRSVGFMSMCAASLLVLIIFH
jgi:hypothetical protein